MKVDQINRIHNRVRAAHAQNRHYLDYVKVSDLAEMLLEIAQLEARVRQLEREAS